MVSVRGMYPGMSGMVEGHSITNDGNSRGKMYRVKGSPP